MMNFEGTEITEPSKEDLQAKYPEVVRHIKKDKNSIREIAKLTGVSVSTVQRVKASL